MPLRALLAAFVVSSSPLATTGQLARADSDHSFDVAYTGDVWHNARGGLQTGTGYVDNLDVQLEINGEAAWGIEGLTLFGYVVYNSGGSVSRDLVGDAQAISNIESPEQTRLYELWSEWAFGPARGNSLRIGLYDLNSEFDASEVGELFTGSENGIGTQIALTGLNGPSIFPVTSLGARFRWQPARDWVVQFVALDGVPGDPEHPSSNRIHLGGDDGLLLVSEAIWLGRGRLRKASVGGWRYTADFDDLLHADATGMPLRRDGNDGVYALLEGNLWGGDSETTGSIDAFLRIGNADEVINRFASAWVVGIVVTGLFASRPNDQLGLAVSAARNGGPYRDASAIAGTQVDSQELHFEFTCRMQVADWLALQPTLHYVANPDTNPSRNDALIIGIRFELSWGKGF